MKLATQVHFSGNSTDIQFLSMMAILNICNCRFKDIVILVHLEISSWNSKKVKRNCIRGPGDFQSCNSVRFSALKGPKGRGKLGSLRLVLAPLWLLCWAYGSPSTATKSLLRSLILGDDLWFVHMSTGCGSITRLISSNHRMNLNVGGSSPYRP